LAGRLLAAGGVVLVLAAPACASEAGDPGAAAPVSEAPSAPIDIDGGVNDGAGPPSESQAGPHVAGSADGEGPVAGPTAEACGRLWLDLRAAAADDLTLAALAGRVETYAAAGCDEVCGPLLDPICLSASCRPAVTD